MNQESILLVDDDPEVVERLETKLRDAGYQITVATDSNAAMEAFRRQVPDLLVLDISLDSGPMVAGGASDGIEVLKKIRAESDVPVLMLTSTSIQSVRLLAFQLGADDYVTKPFHAREVVARAGAILRRGGRVKSSTRSFLGGRLRIDTGAHLVIKDGEEVALTPTEYNLLVSLEEAAGRVLSRQRLLDKIRSLDWYGDERLIDVHIRHLRKKLEDDPANPTIIVTVRGSGYRFGLESD